MTVTVLGGNDDGNVTRTKKLNISIKKTMPGNNKH